MGNRPAEKQTRADHQDDQTRENHPGGSDGDPRPRKVHGAVENVGSRNEDHAGAYQHQTDVDIKAEAQRGEPDHARKEGGAERLDQRIGRDMRQEAAKNSASTRAQAYDRKRDGVRGPEDGAKRGRPQRGHHRETPDVHGRQLSGCAKSRPRILTAEPPVTEVLDNPQGGGHRPISAPTGFAGRISGLSYPFTKTRISPHHKRIAAVTPTPFPKRRIASDVLSDDSPFTKRSWVADERRSASLGVELEMDESDKSKPPAERRFNIA